MIVIEDANDVEPLAEALLEGGINLGNMNDYLALPVVSAVGGAWLATQKQIADKQWSAITDQVREAVETAGNVA